MALILFPILKIPLAIIISNNLKTKRWKKKLCFTKCSRKAKIDELQDLPNLFFCQEMVFWFVLLSTVKYILEWLFIGTIFNIYRKLGYEWRSVLQCRLIFRANYRCAYILNLKFKSHKIPLTLSFQFFYFHKLCYHLLAIVFRHFQILDLQTRATTFKVRSLTHLFFVQIKRFKYNFW